MGAMKRQWNPTVGLGVAVIEEFVLGLVVLGLACGVPGNTSMAMIGLVSVVLHLCAGIGVRTLCFFVFRYYCS